MHTLKVTLKQHTPLIHFQHDQEGATLRASEVKPKLDKFILNTNHYSEIEDGLEKCLIGYTNELHQNGQMERSYDTGKCSLDYKLSIHNIGLKQEVTDLPSYFAEGGCGVNYDQIELQFLSKHELVIEQIQQYISDFFIITNFGNRTSKGYGSYFVDSINDEPQLMTFEEVESVLSYYYPIVYRKNKVSNNVMKEMASDCQLLKSGKNRPYKKSIIFGYAINNRMRWEKRKIKRKIFNVGEQMLRCDNEPIYGKYVDESSWLDPEEDDFPGEETRNFKYFFIRAMLGLPNHYEFMLENGNKLIVDVVRAKPVNNDERHDVEIDGRAYKFSDEIERYKSPLGFKIISIGNESRLYLFSERRRIHPQMSKKTFIFCMKNLKVVNQKVPIENPYYEKIITPDSFDYEAFLQYAMDGGRRDNIPYLNYTRIRNNN